MTKFSTPSAAVFVRAQSSILFFAVMAFSGLWLSLASATTYIYEPFDYGTGSLQGNQNISAGTIANGNSWLQAGTANPPAAVNVASGSLTGPAVMPASIGNDLVFTGNGGATGAANRLAIGQTLAATSTETVYFSFLLNVGTVPNASATGDFFFSLNNTGNSSQTNNTTVQPGKVQLRQNQTNAALYDIEILPQAGTQPDLWYTGLSTGTTQFIVGSYKINTRIASLWVNPSSNTFGLSAAPTADKVSAAGTSQAIASVLMLQKTLLPNLTMDELRVANNWAEVTPVLSLYWDTNGTAAGAGGPTPTGTWDGSTMNWNSDAGGGSGTIGTWTDNVRAIFAGGTDATGAYTVTIDGTQNVGSMLFDEGSVTLTGGTVNINGSGVVDVASGSTATIGSAITGSSGLISTGSGTLVLGGTNSYSGTTSISAGTLQFAQTSAMSGSSTNSVAAGATLALNAGGGGEFGNGVSGATNVGGVIGGGSWTAGSTFAIDTSNAGGTFTYGGVVGSFGGSQDNVTLKTFGTGTLALTNSNTYSGGTNLGGGTLEVSSDSNLGNTSGAITYSSNATLRLTSSMTTARGISVSATSTSPPTGTLDTPGSTDSTLSGVISGSAFSTNNGQTVYRSTFAKSGTGTLRITGISNTFSGIMRVDAGTLSLDNSNALQNATLNPNTGTVVLVPTLGDYNQDGNVDAADYVTWRKTGGEGPLPNDGGTTNHWATWRANFGKTINSLTLGGLTGTGTLALQQTYGPIALTVGNNNTTAGPYTGSLTGPGSLTKIGMGVQTLSGDNTYTGGTTINHGGNGNSIGRFGALEFGQKIAMPASGNIVASAGSSSGANLSGGVLSVKVGSAGEWTNDTTPSTVGGIASLIAGVGGRGTVNQVIWRAGSTLGINPESLGSGGSFEYSGDISGFHSDSGTTDMVGLRKYGAGTKLVLSGTSHFKGPLSVADGGGTVAISGSLPDAGHDPNLLADFGLSVPSVLIGDSNRTGNGLDPPGNFDTGVKILANNALPSDNVVFFSGGSLGASAANNNPPSALFQLYDGDIHGDPMGTSDSYNQTLRGISGSNGRVKIGYGTLTVNVPATESYSWSGTIRTNYDIMSGTHGTFIKTGKGKQELNQNNVNTLRNTGQFGDFIHQDGTVVIGHGGMFGPASAASARLIIEAQAASGDPNPPNPRFSNNSIQNGAGNYPVVVPTVLIKSSFGMDLAGFDETFIGNNGTQDITLQATNPAIEVTNTGALTVNAFVISGRLGDDFGTSGIPRGFTKTGPGMMTITNSDNNYKGETTISAGYLRLTAVAGSQVSPGVPNWGRLGDPTAATNRINLSGGTLSYNGSQNDAAGHGGSTTDPRTLPIPNKLRVTHDSAITYTSTTNNLTDTTDSSGVTMDFQNNSIDWTGGTLTFRHENVAAATTVTYRPTFSGNGFTYGGNVVLDNGGGARKTVLQSTNSTGNQTWNGDMTYNVTNGVATYLRASGGTSTLGGTTINVNITNNSEVIFDRSSSPQAFSGAMSGTGSLTKNGTAALTLSGASTYAGSTTLNSGTTLVNGSLTGTSGVSVTGATLGGTGTINTSAANGNVTLNAGGNLAPGASAGTLTMNLGTGSLDLTGRTADLGALQFELGTPEVGNLDNDNDSDHLVLTAGTLNIGTLKFADFAFTSLTGFGAGTYTLFDATSAITGLIVAGTGSISGFNAALSVDGGTNNVLLTVTTPGSGAGLAGSVPEPTGLALLAIGLMAALGRRRPTR